VCRSAGLNSESVRESLLAIGAQAASGHSPGLRRNRKLNKGQSGIATTSGPQLVWTYQSLANIGRASCSPWHGNRRRSLWLRQKRGIETFNSGTAGNGPNQPTKGEKHAVVQGRARRPCEFSSGRRFFFRFSGQQSLNGMPTMCSA